MEAECSEANLQPVWSEVLDGRVVPQDTGFPFHNIEVDASLKNVHHVESEESSICPNSGPEVTTTSVGSMGINEEGETYAIDIRDYQRRQPFNNSAGNGSMNRKRSLGNSFKCNAKSTMCKSMAKKPKANLTQSVYEREQSVYQMGSGSDWELRGEKTARWQSVCSTLTYSNLHQTAPYVWRSEINNKGESTMRNDNILPCISNHLQTFRPYTGPESEQTCRKNFPIGHQRAYKGKRRYTCTECGKSFSVMSKLIVHERTHTGERPYHCTICGKRFTQKGVLLRHQNMHTGERPHQCSICGKSFNRKDYLLGHQKMHTKTQQHYKNDLLEHV